MELCNEKAMIEAKVGQKFKSSRQGGKRSPEKKDKKKKVA